MTLEEIEEKKEIINHHLKEIAKICPIYFCSFCWNYGDNQLANKVFLNCSAINAAHMLAAIKKEQPSIFEALDIVEFMEKKHAKE